MSQSPTAKFFRTLAGHTIVFGLSALVRPFSQILLVRLHTNTHFVTVEDYAAWHLLQQVALNIGLVALNLGLATAFFRHYMLAETKEEKLRITGRSFRLTVSIAVIGGGLLFLLSDLWADALLNRPGYGWAALE